MSNVNDKKNLEDGYPSSPVDSDFDDVKSDLKSPSEMTSKLADDDFGDAKIEAVANATFKAALAASEPLKPFSKTSIQLYFIICIGFLNAVSSGFDGSLMGGINAMHQYLDFFHYESTGKSTGIIFMMYTVGSCTGSFFAGPASEWFGRRGGMFIGGGIILMAAAIIASAQNVASFLAGRFFLGFGIAISTTAAPTWVTELVPPQWRGRLAGAYNACFFLGSIPATGAMVGTNKMNSTWAWRLPLVLQIIPPIIVMSGVWFCPESPRWLVSRGRLDEARDILIKYHGNHGETNAVIEMQLREFQEQIEVKKLEPFWDYSMLVNTRNARWRLLCVALMCWNGQLAGNGLITYFLPVMFKNAGVRSSQRQLVFNFANSILSAAGAYSGAFATDFIGRRPRLYIGAFVLACMLTIVAVLSKEYGYEGAPTTAANATIAFIFLFGIVYSFVYTPLQALYCAEVLNQRQRAKGMAVHILISNCAGFINTFANSVGLGRLGWKYYFVFVAWNCCASVLWYLFCVETRGRTLEQLDEIFDQPWPARASMKKTKVAFTNGQVKVVG